MAQIKLSSGGAGVGSHSQADINRAIAQTLARTACAGIGATTDSSTGVATGTKSVEFVFSNVAVDGSNLADKTTTEAALGKVKNAIAVAANRGNALSAILGTVALTDNSGGTVATAGTVAALDKTVTGATTGVQAADIAPEVAAINNALYNLVRQANQIARAVGAAPISITGTRTVSGTLAAITIDGGTAAAPGVAKAAVDAALSSWANIIASLAVVYNAARTQSVKVRAN